MNINFFKYQGAGNDFVIVDNRLRIFPEKNRLEIIQRICSRKFGVGSDGLMLLQNDEEHDFYMEFYNPDGSQSFCGNGSRCIVAFANKIGVIENTCSFKSIHGINHATLVKDFEVAIDMFDVIDPEISSDYHYINTGSPHYNIITDNPLDEIEILEEARKVRYNNRFKEEGTNVNFIKEIESGIAIRTYERGVENETLACGTGATACAMSYAISNELFGNIVVPVKVVGGNLSIEFDRIEERFTNVKLIGPAEFVFQGVFNV